MCGTVEESDQEAAPTKAEVGQAGNQGSLKSTVKRHVRSRWTGPLGFGAI